MINYKIDEKSEYTTQSREEIDSMARQFADHYQQNVNILNSDTGELIETFEYRRKRKKYAFNRKTFRIMCHANDKEAILDDMDSFNEARRVGKPLPIPTYNPIPANSVYSFSRVSVVCMLHADDVETFKKGIQWYNNQHTEDQRLHKNQIPFKVHFDDVIIAISRAEELNAARKCGQPLPIEEHIPVGPRMRYGFEREHHTVSVYIEDIPAFKNTIQTLNAKRVVITPTTLTINAHPDDHKAIVRYASKLAKKRIP